MGEGLRRGVVGGAGGGGGSPGALCGGGAPPPPPNYTYGRVFFFKSRAHPAIKSNSLAALQMCVAACWICVLRPRFEQNRDWNKYYDKT